MHKNDVVIIGGGQAGLAMSRTLSLCGIDHVVLERGRIGERWHSERWHSLHLLTPAAMSALPGLPHAGYPEAFMPAGMFASYLTAYARTMDVPVVTGVDVTRVEHGAGGYRISTTAGQWQTRAVVIATGACETAFRPAFAKALDRSIAQVSAANYREPAQLPEGGAIVVGASASGAQLAEEIHASGRPVTLAVGNHSPAPRRYRGIDIYQAVSLAGILDERPVEGPRLERARRQPALQVVGRADNRDLNLKILSGQGIRLLGHVADMVGKKVRFAGDLRCTIEAAHARMLRMLERIDGAIEERDMNAPDADPAVRAPFIVESNETVLDLEAEGIRSVVWASGYVRRYPWLKVPVLDATGEIIQTGGGTAASGLYTLGLNFMRRRRSAFIDGCGLDAEELAPLIEQHLNAWARRIA